MPFAVPGSQGAILSPGDFLAFEGFICGTGLPSSSVCGPFEDPDKSALTAQPFWRVQDCEAVLPIRVSRCDILRPWKTLSLAKLRADRHVLITPDGKKHIRLSSKDGVALLFQSGDKGLFREGADIVAELQVSPRAVRLLDAYWASVAAIRSGFKINRNSKLMQPVEKAELFYQYLVAFDGLTGGKTRREIAVDLFGLERVRAEWSDPNRGMLERVRYRVRRGLSMVNGGYRTLLK